ncbi:FG-GAP-like repeat-containing protein [Rhodopirellula halodulae]|uniref:FG-GAP-like repeat-containing protein n=1 Tax=Rhodopirellula halodulae TaxID=2894198 RepID=UPI003F688C15
MHPVTSTTPAPSSSSKTWLFLVLAVVLIAVGTWWFSQNPNGPGGDDDVKTRNGGARTELATKNLELNRVALASMENLETDKAESAWAELAKSRPDDISIALNRALNRVLTIDELASVANDASAKAEDKRAARQRLSGLLSESRQLIERYSKLGGDSNVSTWLNARVDLNEASLLPRSVMQSIRKEVFQNLIQAISESKSENSTSVLLAGTLTQVIDVLEDPIRGVPEELLAPAANSLAQLSNQQPNNLYLAVRAARLGIASQSKEAVDAIRRTETLAASIEPTLRQQTAPIGKTPAELVDGIANAVEEGRFTEADNQMMLWFNLLNSTELIKTDRRRASPHPLDLIRFESMRRLSAEVSEQSKLETFSEPLQFAASRLPAAAEDDSAEWTNASMVAIDANLDLRPDIVALETAEEQSRLTLWMQTEDDWARYSTLEIDGQWANMTVADLFMVDSSSPGRLRQDGTSQSHNTVRSIVLSGHSGARLIVVDGRSFGTDNADASQGLQSQDNEALDALPPTSVLISGDFEGDGDLDLMAGTERGWELLINRGNRTFFPLPSNEKQATSWDSDDPPSAFAIADLDRDLDLDVITVHPKSGRVGWIENLLHLQFRFSYRDDVPALTGADSLAIEDVDGNVSWDLVIGGRDQGQLVLSHTGDIGIWNVDETQTFRWPDSASDEPGSIIVADLDNDSFYECLRSGAPSSAIEFSPQSADDSTSSLGAQQDLSWTGEIDDQTSTVELAIDFDGDLQVDLAGWSDAKSPKQSPAWVGNNQTKVPGKAVAVRFKGIDDNNANSGRVNHYAIGSVLELRFGPHYRSKIITEPSTHFGLDGLTDNGNLRVIFPNGLTQSVPTIEPGVMIEEEQTLKGSCPYLYAFNGESFEFVTDCLWAAPLGLQTSPGQVVPDRPWEHLLVEGRFLQPRNGSYELRVTEELWEIAYFDHLHLTAIDHPSELVVYTNEKVGPPSVAEPHVHVFDRSELTPVLKATDTTGNDVASELRANDGDHVQGFERRYRQGLCPPHWIDLDLSDRVSNELDANANIHLVLNGWILPTDTSLNIQIDQNPKLNAPEPPSLWIPDPESVDGWKLASPYIGFPGGKNKTIVVDITPWVNKQDPRVRIRTTNQIYWDSAIVSVRTDQDIAKLESQVRSIPLELQSAEVAWHGFSKRTKPGPRRAETYDYQTSTDTPRWPPLRGGLTRYGDAKQLLTQWDDSMVVIAGGDEIRLRFAEPEEEVAPGQQRDFILHGVGWDKDADLNTLAGQSTLPLPFQSMGKYPPTLSDESGSEQAMQKNQSHLSRKQSFREFWHRGQ